LKIRFLPVDFLHSSTAKTLLPSSFLFFWPEAVFD